MAAIWSQLLVCFGDHRVHSSALVGGQPPSALLDRVGRANTQLSAWAACWGCCEAIVREQVMHLWLSSGLCCAPQLLVPAPCCRPMCLLAKLGTLTEMLGRLPCGACQAPSKAYLAGPCCACMPAR